MAGKKKEQNVQPTPEATPTAPLDGDLSHLDAAGDPEPVETPPETPAVTPPPAPVAKLPKSPHPAGLRRRALVYGATAEQIDAVTVEELDEWVDQRDQDREVERAVVKVPPKPPAVDDDIDWGTDAEGKPLTEADISPGIARNIRAQAKKLKELEAKDKARDEQDAKRQQLSVNEACDTAIEALGEKYEKVFGKGDMREIPQGSNAAKRRKAAYLEAGIDMKLDSPAAIVRKLKKAALTLFHDLIEVPAPKPAPKVEDNLYAADDDEPVNGKHPTKEEWDKGTLAAPTNRKSAHPVGREAALAANVRNFFKEHNIKNGTEDEQFEGVPK